MAFEEPIIGASGAAGAGYAISQSCRFNDDDSAQTGLTMAAGTSTKIATFSFWIKRGNLGTVQHVFGTESSNTELLRFLSTDAIRVDVAGSAVFTTSRLFRDVGAWYHIVIVLKTTDSTSADRCQIWVNGVRETAFSSESQPSQDTNFTDLSVNTKVLNVGVLQTAEFFDGYLAEFVYIDGTAYSASDFGETDDNNNWIPKSPADLTFGTNGAWLDFAVAPGTGDGAGTDVSGEGNHFTDSGLATNDQVPDSPTDDAENDVGNYATWNPLYNINAGTFAEGNLQFHNAAALWGHTLSTISMPDDTGKYYWEVDHYGSLGGAFSGVYTDEGTFNPNNTAWTTEGNWSSRDGGNWRHEGGTTAISSNGGSAGDIFYFAYDSGTRKIWCGVAAGWFNGGDPGAGAGSLGTMSGTGTVFAAQNSYSASNGGIANFGQQAFNGTPPTGFTKRLCTAHGAAPAIKDPSKYFQVDTFTGTGSELVRTLTDAAGDAVKPDLVWNKDRDTGSTSHQWVNSVRGATKEMSLEKTADEVTVGEGVKSFDTSGYTLGTDAGYNASSGPHVSFCFVAGSGSGSSNTDGGINTISTTVSQTAGFSISTYTGTGSASTVGHGLGAIPTMMMWKRVADESWVMYHQNMNADPEDYHMHPDTTVAAASENLFNSTAPTSSVFSVSAAGQTNASGSVYIHYAWTEIPGFSKFGVYEGNANADGTFVYCGFRPAMIWTKNIDGSANWFLFDHKRNGYNAANKKLETEDNTAEGATAMDILSNGFKWRLSGAPNTAVTQIWMAWAEFPFGGDGVSQARAR